MKQKLEKVEQQAEIVTFQKSAILRSQKYRNYRDFLSGTLETAKSYTVHEVDEIIRKFEQG